MPQPPSNAGSLIGERLGKYEMLALIALGGTAEIYLARIGGAAGFEKYVVVKCLHDHLADDNEFVRMFLDEARLGAQLDHSNIVQTLELGEHEGRYYLVMEYLAGMSLALIARKCDERGPGGRLPVHLVLGLAAQACAALHYAHERTSGGKPLNIVHRDISPQNLVISFEGILKLVDFGIAKAEQRETHTKSGTIKGKFAYMSPEQCLAGEVDRRTDIFALGVIVHELLTGRRLFKRNSTYETYQAILEDKVLPPSSVNHELDPSLDDVVMRALSYDKENRYPTAEAFGEALLGVLHRRGKPVSAGDIARFFEQHFAKEIDEHRARMRELISGRPSTLEEIQWDSADPDSGVALAMPDDMPDPPRPPDTIDPTVDAEPLDADDEYPTVDQLRAGDRAGDAGGDTRIELNPLERVQRLHAEHSGEHPALPSAEERSTRIEAPLRARGKRGPSVSESGADLQRTRPTKPLMVARPRLQPGDMPRKDPDLAEEEHLSDEEHPTEEEHPLLSGAGRPASVAESDAAHLDEEIETLSDDRSPELRAALRASGQYPPVRGAGPGMPQAGQLMGFSDLDALARERAASRPPRWAMVVAFVAAVALGIAITVAIGLLIT